MKRNNMPHVLYDCDKMKYKNTGLHTFNVNLVKALGEEGSRRGYLFSAFSLKKVIPFVRSAQIYPQSFWHRVFFWLPRRIKVWHSPFQFGKYSPMSGQKVVLTIHDLNFLYEKEGRKTEKGLRILQKNINRATHLVAISNFTRDDVLKHLETKNKPFDVIYNGTIPIDPSSVDDSLNLCDKEFIFTVSTILPKKNIHVLPCLLVGNEYELIVAGNLSPYADKIMAEAELYGVADRVRIVGPVEESEKNWYLKHCQAFMFPSIAEGFGIPVIEAMNFGKPVFLSQHTCLPEIGRDYCYYFNYDFDREQMQREFSAGMEDFNKNGDPQRITNYSKQFSWEKAASEYWDIYEKLMSDED